MLNWTVVLFENATIYQVDIVWELGVLENELSVKTVKAMSQQAEQWKMKMSCGGGGGSYLYQHHQ